MVMATRRGPAGQHLGRWFSFRQVQAGGVDLEDDLGAHAGAVQLERLAGQGNAVVEFDAGHLDGGKGRHGGQQGGGHKVRRVVLRFMNVSGWYVIGLYHRGDAAAQLAARSCFLLFWLSGLGGLQALELGEQLVFGFAVLGMEGMQLTGHTCWHCGSSKWPTHSVHLSGLIS
jgi:hypothetical protein